MLTLPYIVLYAWFLEIYIRNRLFDIYQIEDAINELVNDAQGFTWRFGDTL